ncbi:MAG: N-acetyltransferase, partial [Hyphomicrobiales bacterium]|nr:N-acetyltransferase [Hyphomicrobiales bacterium]
MEKYKLTIHPSSIVSKNASLGKDVCVGPYSIIYDNVIIGDNTRIDGFCEIGVSSHLSGS